MPVCRSRTNTSVAPFVSPTTRLVAALSKATKRPSAERAELKLAPLPSVPPEATLTRSVVCASADRPQRAVSRTRVTELRTRRCTGRIAPPLRRVRFCSPRRTNYLRLAPVTAPLIADEGGRSRRGPVQRPATGPIRRLTYSPGDPTLPRHPFPP